jgi:murein DD-endopeptidase MepM/ murein hydrolase activator NlpD
MAIIPGIDFYSGQYASGATSGDMLAWLAGQGVRFGIAKVGQAFFLDGRWDEHKAAMDALSGSFVKGAYWFLQRDFPADDTAGYFYPPFTEDHRYITSSYGGHNDYAVDFNRVNASNQQIADEGDAVRASAAGTVGASTLAWSDTSGFYSDGSWQNTYGTRFINHTGGYRTQYTHMRNILVNAGDVVTRGQKLGEVSTKGSTGQGDPDWAHLHGVHYRKTTAGPYVPVKMRFQNVAMTASRADTYTLVSPRWTGQTVVGPSLPSGNPAYTGTSQAEMFLDALGGDPTGYMCVVDVEGGTSAYGLPARWLQVKQFADEFWRQAPGYPLFIYTTRNHWNTSVLDGSAPANARDYGFAGIWTADWSQVGESIGIARFATDGQDLSFVRTAETPNAGGYAGFTRSTLLQWGSPDYVAGGLRYLRNGTYYRVDGNAFDGTVRELRGLANGTGDPDVVAGEVPNLYNIVEATALTTLTAAGYVAGVSDTEYHLNVVAGRVTRTDPPSGTALPAGESVDYWVSLGDRTNTVVPDVVNDHEDSALESFTQAGLVAGVRTTANSATIPLDFVISTTPAAGTAAALASSVAYVVSLGPVAVGGTLDPEPASPCV